MDKSPFSGIDATSRVISDSGLSTLITMCSFFLAALTVEISGVFIAFFVVWSLSKAISYVQPVVAFNSRYERTMMARRDEIGRGLLRGRRGAEREWDFLDALPRRVVSLERASSTLLALVVATAGAVIASLVSRGS
jgi:hypothetical protein